ncbi:MAG: class I SAM-dependent methyltransferase [Actinobacteria bacterium]|nr:class I SAM-dependent methyltransferase [Actinomycetota bacterium]
MRLANATGGPILELGCGTGRLTKPLAALGFDVVGLDNDPEMLEWSAPGVTLVEGDMRAFDLGRRFPLVIIPYNSLQLLPPGTERTQCFASIARHLQPDGLLALEVTDFLVGETAPFAPNEPLAAAEGITLYAALDSSPAEGTSWYQRRYVFDDGTPDVRDTVVLHEINEAELEHLAAAAGLEVVEAEHSGRHLSWVAKAGSASVGGR